MMFVVGVDFKAFLEGLGEFHFGQARWVELLAANIGAVIMPWMLYYQQSACVQRKMTTADMKFAKADTAVGAVLTQLVMSSMVITLGATKFITNPGQLENLAQVTQAIEGPISPTTAKIIVSFGTFGACMVAAIVVTICPAWSICEALGIERTLDKPYAEAKGFYNSYLLLLIIAAVVACIPGFGDATWLSIQVEILNALLMPPVIFVLFMLCTNPNVLPEKYLLTGWYKWLLAVVFAICSGLCLYACVVDAIYGGS